MIHLRQFLVLSILYGYGTLSFALTVEAHEDTLVIDENLSLRDVIDATYQHYPQQAIVKAYEDEVQALEQRSTSWIAGYPMVYLQYIDDALISNQGISEIQSGYQVPVWMWGQKEASQRVTDQSSLAAERYAVALKHEIAGLVRNALWNIRITENRRDLAHKILAVADELLRVVRRRVELGDMSKSDMLLAESDALEKKSLLMQAEAEVIHANKAYQSLTRTRLMPGRFEEKVASDRSLSDSHPALAAATASVERAQAEVDFVRLSKQGNQPSVMIGTDSTSVQRSRDYGTGTNLVFQIPIGGDDWHAPQVAQANVILNEKLAQREALHRQLEKAAHEAEHILDLDQKALVVASRRKEIAEEQLRMSKIALENGEISMIDYLKIQSTAQTALKDAAERNILVLKDISTLHQAVGISP
ncbi:MAG TPA: TolC family protein [Methylococcaceae bacterium]|jgi:outer membrane protein TolC|nr:TolC family protein [Methylococcaceae bacterium]